MANLGKIVYLTEEQKNTLFQNNYITVNGRTIVYNDNDLYLTPFVPSSGSGGAVSGVKGDNESNYRIGEVNITKDNIGLGNVENKSSSTIRGELTDANVINALGYTPGEGTITEILMNGESMGTSGAINLGTVLTSHQDIRGKADLDSPNFIGVPTSITPLSTSNSKMIATKEYVDNAFQVNDAMVFKGIVDSTHSLPNPHYQGWTYKVSEEGTYAGQYCEVGDTIYCIADGTTADNSHWVIVQTNIEGAVIGPANSTAGHIATFTGATGKAIQDSGFTIATSVPDNAKFTDTDTKVTSAANHYTPSTVSGQNKTVSASGATAAWGIDVVKGITLNTDGKGHVTGISVTSGKIPGSPVNNLNSDSTTESLSAAQGKALRELIESQAGSSSGGGSLTIINTGVGLTGGPISTSGTIKANLNSETSLGTLGTTSQLYAVGVDNNGKLAVSVPWTDNNTTYSSLSAVYDGTAVSLVTTGEKYTWNDKQSKITASGILKGNGSGSISAAIAGTDYATPAQVNAKYTKPSSGIPKSDLTSAVQMSLEKADTALQSHQTVSNKKATLAWGALVTIATIGNTDIEVALPDLPVYTGAGTWA